MVILAYMLLTLVGDYRAFEIVMYYNATVVIARWVSEVE